MPGMPQLASPPGKDGQAPKAILSPNLTSTPTYLRGVSPARRSSPRASPLVSPNSGQHRVSASPGASASTFRSAPSRRKVSAAIAAIQARKSGAGALRSPSPVTSPNAPSATVQDENRAGFVPKHLPLSPRSLGESKVGSSNKPSGAVSPAREPLSPMSTGSSQTQTNQAQSLFFSAFSSRIAPPAIPVLTLDETNQHATDKKMTSIGSPRKPAPSQAPTNFSRGNPSDPITKEKKADLKSSQDIRDLIDKLHKKENKEEVSAVADIFVGDSSSDESDDSVDPTVTEGIGAFIDSLQKDKERKPDMVKEVIPAVSTSTDESECKVEPETLAEIGEVIDSIVKKPKEAADVTLLLKTLSSESSNGGSIPEETKADIGAFIDSLQTKQVTEDDKKTSDPPGDKMAVYVSSSEESGINDKKIDTVAETEEELEKFISKMENQKEKEAAPHDTKEIRGVVTESSLDLDVSEDSTGALKPDKMATEGSSNPQGVDYVQGTDSETGGKDTTHAQKPDEMRDQGALSETGGNKNEARHDGMGDEPDIFDVDFGTNYRLTKSSIQSASRTNLLKINFVMRQLMKLYENGKEPLSDELNAIRNTAESLGIQPVLVENLIMQGTHPEAREIADLSDSTSFDDLELQRLLAEDEEEGPANDEIRAFLTRFAHLTIEEEETDADDSRELEKKIDFYTKKISQLYARGEVTEQDRKAMLEEASHNDVPASVITGLFHDVLLNRAASNDSDDIAPNSKEVNSKPAYPLPPENCTSEDLMVKLAPPEGSSHIEISKVNFIMKKLAALHEDNGRPQQEDLDEIRRAAQRVNIPDDLIQDMIDYASLPPEIQNTLSEASTFDDEELDKALASDKFSDIKEYDESDDIEAYLKRYAHLARGGHFPQANIESMGSFGKQADDEEGVEYDAEFGYVKAELVPLEEDEEWWEGKDTGAVESETVYSEMSSKLTARESAEVVVAEGSEANEEESTTMEDILDKESINDSEDEDEVLLEESVEDVESVESAEDESLSVNPWTSQDSEDMLSEIYEADPDDEKEEHPVGVLEVIDDESVKGNSVVETVEHVDDTFSLREASEEESVLEEDGGKPWWEDDDEDDEPSVASLVARLSDDGEDGDDSESERVSTASTRESKQSLDMKSESKFFTKPEEVNLKNNKHEKKDHKTRGHERESDFEGEIKKIASRDRYLRDPTGKPDWREREHNYVSSARAKKYEEDIIKTSPSKGMIGDLENMFEKREQYQLKAQRALKHWKNPWDQNSKITRTKNGKPIPLSGVAAARAIKRWSPKIRKNRKFEVAQTWRMSYSKRTQYHPGYFNVDIYSLYGTSVVAGVESPLDPEPWENRDVKQYFLHEKSISFTRNWFGDLRRERGNDPYREPVCRPESMEMPMDDVGDNDEWDQDWYLTWQCKREMGALIAYSQSFDDSAADTRSRASSARFEESITITGTYEDDCESEDDDGSMSDDESWDELPTCGTIHNVKLKIGERVSRVHPNYTSSLRRSRWRKKYFPRGTFPYK